VRAGVSANTILEPEAFLTALSSLPSGGRISRGERWDGIPARPAGQSPSRPQLLALEVVVSPFWHGVALILARFALWMLLVLSVELPTIALALLHEVDVEDLVPMLEGDVEDVSRQHIANRASVTIHPAPWYVGIRAPSYFVDQKTGLKTEIVTVSPGGAVVADVPVTVTLTQVKWLSVRRAEGGGFYAWDTERKEVPAGTWTVTTSPDPVPLDIPVPNGGYYMLEAVAKEESGRFAVTRTSFYALGDGYTAWARFDHNRIELVSERQSYRPGDSAPVSIIELVGEADSAALEADPKTKDKAASS